jgi:hypothetical protein
MNASDIMTHPALHVLAENAPGVKEVGDCLAWVEPLSGFVVPADGSVVSVSDG